jgi:hypothetical protein
MLFRRERKNTQRKICQLQQTHNASSCDGITGMNDINLILEFTSSHASDDMRDPTWAA